MPAKGMLPLDAALAEVRAALLDRGRLIRAVAAGRRKGTTPSLVRAQLRPVALKSGDRLQVVTDDGARPHTRNVDWEVEGGAAVDALLAEPFGNWHVETVDETLQLRVTKKGDAQLHRAPTASDRAAAPAAHDRVREHLLDPGDPLFDVIGGTAAKRRQVDAFLRALDAVLGEDPDLPQPLRVVDLGCGNAYLTFAGYRYLTKVRGLTAELVGVDVREDQRVRNTELAAQLGWSEWVRFEAGTIAEAPVAGADVVLALHACDTATDEALARAVGWRARYVLAAPCCHHDLATQLRGGGAPAPYSQVVRFGILRERFADVLTDTLRAQLLRLQGYTVEVVEFIDSRHTPRNLLLRARRTGTPPTAAQRAEYAQLVEEWGLKPHLSTLLDQVVAPASS
ncbi:SAM-dependent methyltransferase [Luedemannella flava]|uniref:SAM-dependent methyltransferase n=1 Tax=Luedemannella flava TaxID=349316 RepID=A0ABN2LPC8_9ACTN